MYNNCDLRFALAQSIAKEIICVDTQKPFLVVGVVVGVVVVFAAVVVVIAMVLIVVAVVVVVVVAVFLVVVVVLLVDVDATVEVVDGDVLKVVDAAVVIGLLVALPVKYCHNQE